MSAGFAGSAITKLASHDLPDRGNHEDENKAGAQASDSISDLANTSLLDEVGKNHDPNEREDDPKTRKSFSVCPRCACHSALGA